jgi:hypothetical protein
MTASFQILSNSWFTNNPTLKHVSFEILIVSHNEPQKESNDRHLTKPVPSEDHSCALLDVWSFTIETGSLNNLRNNESFMYVRFKPAIRPHCNHAGLIYNGLLPRYCSQAILVGVKAGSTVTRPPHCAQPAKLSSREALYLSKYTEFRNTLHSSSKHIKISLPP